MPACVLSSVQLFSTPWTVALQAPVYGIFQARILEWVAIPSFRESSGLMADSLPLRHLESPKESQRGEKAEMIKLYNGGIDFQLSLNVSPPSFLH